jgi:hypothetical protein
MTRLRSALAAGVAAAALLAGAAEAAELKLKRVLLSTGGVGLYEYEADVEGDASVELKAPLDQIDDILKSLVVFDDKGGVGGLDLAGAEPLAETFRALPFTAADLQSTPRLLNALRGAEVEVGAPRALKGRIVAVADETETSPQGATLRHRVTLAGEDGLESFVLEQAESLRFADPAVREAVAKALTAVAAEAEKGARAIKLQSRGQGARKLHVAYLAAAPIWKASYRLVLDGDRAAKQARLQGWATLENFSGQDWSGVDLTLVSGRPVAYRQALYRVYKIDRPEAPVDIGAKLNPGVDAGAMAAPAPAPAPMPTMQSLSAHKAMRPRNAFAAAPPVADEAVAPPQPPLSPAAAAAAAQEGETQVAFRLPFPVSVGNGRTLSLPILDADEPVERVAIYDASVDARHPLSAAELTNGAATALPPGIVTIYEADAAGTSYVGDSRLAATPAGETRLLSYALDPKTTVEEDDSDNATLAKVSIAKGVLTVDDVTRRRTVYRVKAAEPRRLVVFAPKLEGGTLTAPVIRDAKQAEGRYRLPFDVAAGDGQSFDVVQERTDQRLVALASLDDAGLAVYAKSGKIDAASRATLEKLAELRAKQTDAERAVADAQAKIEAATADQTRLKDLLAAVASGSDLSKRYLRKLDADETELESLNAGKAQREKARDEAARAVEAFVAGL